MGNFSSLPTLSKGDVSNSETLTDNDHLYPAHINELRQLISVNIPELMNRGDFPYTAIVAPSTESGKGNYYTDIQSAIDSLPSSGGVVFIKPGTYEITSTITITKHFVALIGSGARRTYIEMQGNTSPVIQIGSTSTYVRMPILKDLTITRDLQGESKTNTVGLWVLNTGHPEMCIYEGLTIYGHYYNIKMGDGGGGHRPAGFGYWANCEIGSYWDTANTAMMVSGGIEQHFFGCRFMGYEKHGVAFWNTGSHNDFSFRNCYFASIKSGAVNSADYNVEILKGHEFEFSGCVFEEGRVSNIRIRGGRMIRVAHSLIGGAGGTGFGIIFHPDQDNIQEVKIIGNTIRDYAQANSDHSTDGRAIFFDTSTYTTKQIAITGNSIDVQGSGGIRIDKGNHITITGNSFQRNSDDIAIELNSGADYCSIVGNCFDYNGAGSVNIVNIASGSTYHTVIGNTFEKGGATAINNAGGATNIIDHNAGV